MNKQRVITNLTLDIRRAAQRIRHIKSKNNLELIRLIQDKADLIDSIVNNNPKYSHTIKEGKAE